jgi:hypothetical protein
MSVSAPDSPTTLIAATRDDGLGGRLLAMVNAKTLADTFGCRFGFTWNRRAIADKTFHVVDVADKIFSRDFIDKHWLGEKVRASDFGMLDAAALAGPSLGAVAKEKKLRGWICNDFHILRHVPGDAAQSVRASQTLRGFDYAPAVNEAIGAANRCLLPGPMAALHLRSGDIVHGQHRASLVFAGKVIPSTLARAIISRLSAMGMATLLIGQHRPTLDYLKAGTGAMLGSDFGADAFEDQMRDRQAEYHPREAAFGYQAAFLAMEAKATPADARAVLEKARVLDPENDAYALKIAAAYFRERDYASGEALLKSVMTSQFRRRPKIPLMIMRLLGDMLSSRYSLAQDFEHFIAAGEAGLPYASACSAWILQQTTSDRERALAMADRAVKAAPGDLILKQVKRRILQGKRPRSGLVAKAKWRIAWLRGLRAG